MAQSIFNFHLGQAPRDSFLGGVMQRQIFNSHRRLQGNTASRFGALLAMTGLLLLSACGGGKSGVTDNNLAEPPFKDGVPPTLTSISIRESTKSAKPSGFVQVGKSARVDIVASESLMKPVITINDVEAEVIGAAGLVPDGQRRGQHAALPGSHSGGEPALSGGALGGW